MTIYLNYTVEEQRRCLKHWFGKESKTVFLPKSSPGLEDLYFKYWLRNLPEEKK